MLQTALVHRRRCWWQTPWQVNGLRIKACCQSRQSWYMSSCIHGHHAGAEAAVKVVEGAARVPVFGLDMECRSQTTVPSSSAAEISGMLRTQCADGLHARMRLAWQGNPIAPQGQRTRSQ
jgi:hypothetical protein